MKILKILSISIFVLAAIFYFLIGYKNHRNEFYEFSYIERDKNATEIMCRLIGTYQYNDKETIYTNPYEIFIAMKSDKKQDLLKLVLVNLTNGDTILLKEKPELSKLVNAKDTIISYYSLKNINVPHSDLKLQFYYGCDNANDSIEANFKAHYRTYKSNKLWGILSGV